MPSESLLKALRQADEKVLEQHTRIAESVREKKGISKNTLSNILGFTSIGIGCIYSLEMLIQDPIMTRQVVDEVYEKIKTSLYLFRMFGFGGYLNAVVIWKNCRKSSGSCSVAVDPVRYYADKMSVALRLPGFTAGLLAAGYSLCKTFSSGSNLSDNLDLLVLAGFVALGASALYMKDADPELLEKQTFPKIAYDWVKGRLFPSVPERALQPQPALVKTYTASDVLDKEDIYG